MKPNETFATIMVTVVICGFAIQNPLHLFEDVAVKAEDVAPTKAPGSVDGPANITEVKYLGVVTPSPKPVTVEDKIRATFPEDPDTAVKIAKCESGLNTNAINRKNRNKSVDYGLMQINSVHKYSEEYLLDTDNNLKAARKIFDRSGWLPWVCFRKIGGE